MKTITAVLLCAFWCSGVQAGERLSAADLKELYSGKTVTGVHFKHGPGRVYYSEDGSVVSNSDSGKTRSGKWWIDAKTDTRCVRWDHMDKDLCHYTEKNEDGTYSLINAKNGKELVRMNEVQAGNQL
ncbi:MAG: hypothetical protein ABW095_03770 [Candidatus Thiodiazotropha sp.]